jgi:hypothetical protein
MNPLPVIENLPTTGWGVVALMLLGLLYVIVLLTRGLSSQKQINMAVNHRNSEEPTLVSMVSEIHADHRQLRDDVAFIRSEVNGLQVWKAGYAGTELGNAADIGKVLTEVRDGIRGCKGDIARIQSKVDSNGELITQYGCPVKLQQADTCLKNQPTKP